MTNLTYETVVPVLNKLLEERGDGFVYEQVHSGISSFCLYSTADGEADCIVGAVLKELEPDIFKRVHDREWRTPGEPRAVGAIRFLEDEDFTLAQDDRPLLIALDDMQGHQDTGSTWRSAVDAFHRVYQSASDLFHD